MASVFNPSSWLKHLDFHAFSSWIYIFVYIILLSVAIACMLSLTLYFLPTMLLCLLKPQNMRKKYGNWAVVTGGSSGIGKAITRLLASQGVNVFIIALDDHLLKTTHKELCDEFPNVDLRAVGVDLGQANGEYMERIIHDTRQVDVSILVNNAGFLVLGFFHARPIQAYMANLHCNSTAAITLTHHFYKRMIQKRIRGCIMFTSSAACFLPAPFASIYGASKALLSHFATSLAIEAQQNGIDVTVFHPSYTHSNLYANSMKLDIITLLSKMGWTPDDVAERMLACVGRVIVYDIGIYAIVTNLLGRFLDSGFLAMSIIPFRDSMAPIPDETADKKAQ